MQGKAGIWLKVPVGKVGLVAGAVEHGFELHHAEKDYVMLTTWCAPSTPGPKPQGLHDAPRSPACLDATPLRLSTPQAG